MQLSGKVALVTGAGSGIGRATALLLAQEGAKVAALDLRQDRTEEMAATIAESGGETIGLAADVANAGEMEQAVARIIDHWGRLDLVVANAGINGVWAPIEVLQGGLDFRISEGVSC